ncbi:MAG: hypothetical protein IJ071_08415 [Ruminococcus sp.]|nr:hypothetical protein [Ruminococcus sp.]
MTEYEKARYIADKLTNILWSVPPSVQLPTRTLMDSSINSLFHSRRTSQLRLSGRRSCR